MDQPTATVLAAAFSAFGTMLAAYIAVRLFSGKIKTIESAVSKVESLVDNHHLLISAKIETFSGNVERQFTATIASLSNVSGELDGFIESSDQSLERPGNVVDTLAKRESITQADNLNQRIDDVWTAARQRLDELAAAEIDGRRRAKYARIDRRSYYTLIQSLAADDKLGNDEESFSAMAEIYHRFRNRRVPPLPLDLQRMQSLARRVGL